MFAGVDGSERLYHYAQEHLPAAPRLRLPADDKMVFRGGVGLFAGFLGQRRGDVIQSGLLSDHDHRHHVQRLRSADPADILGHAFLTTPILEPVGARAGPADVPRAEHLVLQPGPRGVEAAPLAGRPPARAAGRLTLEAAYVGNYGYDIEITRNINALPNQYLNADNSRTAAMVANNIFLDRDRPESVRGTPAGQRVQQSDHRAPAAAAAVPGLRGHQHHEQRRQVLVPLRPVRTAEALLEGLHPGRLLHLFAAGAGHGIPQPGRRRADADDLGSGRDAPTVRERHLRPPVRQGPAVPARTRAGSPTPCSAAGRFRASTPTRPASRSRSGTLGPDVLSARQQRRVLRRRRPRFRPASRAPTVGSTPASSRRC